MREKLFEINDYKVNYALELYKNEHDTNPVIECNEFTIAMWKAYHEIRNPIVSIHDKAFKMSKYKRVVGEYDGIPIIQNNDIENGYIEIKGKHDDFLDRLNARRV